MKNYSGTVYALGIRLGLALPGEGTTPHAPAQLYNLQADPGETMKLHDERPEVVQELKALLEQSKASGRSRPASKP